MVYRPTARILTVLELLQAHGQMTGQELAARLEVDMRTVRRYITTLQDIGIPIEAEMGRYGGYALRPGFKLPPLMFSDDEVLVLTLGLLMTRRSGLADAGLVAQRALAKIERVLPLALRDQLRALAETMQLTTQLEDVPALTEVSGEIIAGLSLANQQCQRVRLVYANSDTPTERVFDPYSVIYHQGLWYTVGFCHLRRDLRIFRLDRVQSVTLLDSTFTPPPNFDAVDYMLTSFVTIPDRWNIEVLLDMSFEAARKRIPRELATLTQTDQGVCLRTSMPDFDMIAHLLIGLGCRITVIEPPELRAEFLKIAEEIRGFAEA